MRGVHGRKKGGDGMTVGSSPHARGPSGEAVQVVPDLGIIPACAGSIHGSYPLRPVP